MLLKVLFYKQVIFAICFCCVLNVKIANNIIINNNK